MSISTCFTIQVNLKNLNIDILSLVNNTVILLLIAPLSYMIGLNSVYVL